MGTGNDPSGTAGAAGVLWRPPQAAPAPRAPELRIDVAFQGLSDAVLVPPDYAGVKQLVWRLYVGCGEGTVRLFWDRLRRREREMTADLARIFRALDRSQGLPDESAAMLARVRQAQGHCRRAWAELIQVETTFLGRYEAAILGYAAARFADRTADLTRWWTQDYVVVTTADPAQTPDPAGKIDPTALSLAPKDPALRAALLADTVKLAARWKQYSAIVQFTLPALKDLRPTAANRALAQRYAREMRVRRVLFERLAAEVEQRHPVALLAYRRLARRAATAPGQAGQVEGQGPDTTPPGLVMREGEPPPARAAEEEVIAAMHRAIEGARDALARFKALRVFRDGRTPPPPEGERALAASGAERVGRVIADADGGHGAVWAQQPLHVQFDADLARLLSVAPVPPAPDRPGAVTTPRTRAFLGTLSADQIRRFQRAGVPGSVANRARKEVFGHMEAVIKARKARIETIAAVTAAAGLLLAIPTDGASIYVAAAIDLELAAIEAGIDIRAYLDQAALGSIAIAAEERMYWVAPELATLAGRISELGLRALGDVVLDGAASHLIDAISVVALIAQGAR
ncbi:hypothetical protein [Phenylobacterium sp.]|uniref:hypothetical protein n=1 Tax=Phenylobacterium sp. TaxID=1871053 RepID=UPI0025EE7819|nr:hypothetical protein [Phenylobacterium sp.]MCA3521547.1 hypothetical protein [Rhodobacter sp.]MCA3549143.1 hypothetical protein [Rhodobacter sp.]MCA6263714.1 hypothetical protein [Phenylobacterium sp.]MCA6280344.1 hypothetical protein [Phenylobacterium sp.]MCA6317260.1 hypothetical protein [Phenylobacterium sp.]